VEIALGLVLTASAGLMIRTVAEPRNRQTLPEIMALGVDPVFDKRQCPRFQATLRRIGL
jgi:hypothetical protein